MLLAPGYGRFGLSLQPSLTASGGTIEGRRGAAAHQVSLTLALNPPHSVRRGRSRSVVKHELEATYADMVRTRGSEASQRRLPDSSENRL
jgi:hypothetical protein